MKSLKDSLLQKNILYIHGLGSDKNSETFKNLKKGFPQFNWITDTFDLLDIDDTIDKIEKILIKYNISIVVASSLGAFYALNIKNSLAKIVINPCMRPSVEIPKLVVNQSVPVEKFKVIENDTYGSIDGEMRIGTFGVFGSNDELFSYKKEFEKLYGHNIVLVAGKHRLNNRTLLSSVQYGFDYFDNLHSILKEGIVNEHFVNILTKEVDKDKLNKYKDEVYNILQKAYAPIGGILGCENIDMLVNDSDFWKIVTKGSKIIAVAIYTFKRGGRKMMYCGTDGTSEGKENLYKLINDDMRLKDRNAWVEVNDKMEYIYKKQGAIPVPAEVAQKIMKDKPFLKIHDDGFHYDRYIGGEVHTKIMMGNI